MATIELAEMKSRCKADEGTTDLLFVVLLVLAPVTTSLSRFFIRVVPISWFLQILTPFSADRIQSERHRIISEGGDLLGFVMFLALAAGVAVLLLSHLRTLVPRPVVLQHHPYIIPVLSSTLLLFHLGSLHKWRVNSFGDVFLDGFGLPRTALVMLCLFLFLRERHLGNLGAWFDHNVTRIIACVVIATSLTPFVFPIWRGVDNVRHLEISLNELAAPAAGMGIFEDFFRYIRIF